MSTWCVVVAAGRGERAGLGRNKVFFRYEGRSVLSRCLDNLAAMALFDGIALVISQADEEACRAMHRKAFRSFPISRVYQAHIPTCPSGYWLFGFASKKYHPLHDLDARRWRDRHLKTWYYTTNLHMGAFMLPKYVEDLLEEEEKRG